MIPMTEYTPSTDDVRAAYCICLNTRTGAPDAVLVAEFDRWLQKTLAEAWDEGMNVGFYSGQSYHDNWNKNPYRAREGE